MIRRPPRSTQGVSSAASDVYKRQVLRQLISLKELVVVGSMSHMCIDGITRAAADLGYGVTVIHDACASRDLEFNGLTVPAAHVHAAFMSALGFAYASVVSTDQFLAVQR